MARRRFTTETLAVNLVPATDITFQLLLFFMLSTDLSQRFLEKSPTFILPRVSHEEEKKKGDHHLTHTLNIFHKNDECDKLADKELCNDNFYKGGVCEIDEHWGIKYKGEQIDEKVLLKALKEFARLGQDKSKSISENVIILYADKRTPYAKISAILRYLAQAKIYKVKAFVEEKP